MPVDRSLQDTSLTRFGFWSGVWVLFFCTQKCKAKCGCGAVVAHHLAKVRVASSNLVIRSSVKLTRGWSTDWWPPSGGLLVWWSGREARHRPAKPFTRVQIPSPPPIVADSGLQSMQLSK